MEMEVEVDNSILLEDFSRASDDDKPVVTINDLPDEVLENLFSRLSPYCDLDSIRSVSLRWNRIAKGTVQSLKSHFHQSIFNGKLACKIHPTVCENYRTISGWPQERFGQMACYYDKSLYVIGGSTHRSTTFNDMWKFDLGSRTWSRIVSHGKYPSPKALASCSQYKDNIYIFGGWVPPAASPYMAPWRLFDELNGYNVTTNTWSLIVSSPNPPPMAGHSCTTFGDEMVIFGGRTYDMENQSYPVSNDTWIFDFIDQEWFIVDINKKSSAPSPRYGQTQIALDESNILIIGGCDGPGQIFNDIWLLNIRTDEYRRRFGTWKQVSASTPPGTTPPMDLHYSGCRVGDDVIFLQQYSSISPYLGFLHFDCQNLPPFYQHGITFEASKEPFVQRRRSSSGAQQPSSSIPRQLNLSPTMSLYSLDISKVISENKVGWRKEVISNLVRPDERFLYSVIGGRSEIIIFGGFFKEPNGRRFRVSSDVFILHTVPKTY